MQIHKNKTNKQSHTLNSIGRLLSKKELVELIGISTASITRWAQDPQNIFPAAMKIGPNRVAWSEASIIAWLESLKAQEVVYGS
jgi:predicted DNA-binding transcriptional regulator AlpA